MVSNKIGEIIHLDDENDQKISSFSVIPNEFFEDMETPWKGRVKRVHIDNVFIEVERAAEALSLAVGICSSTLPVFWQNEKSLAINIGYCSILFLSKAFSNIREITVYWILFQIIHNFCWFGWLLHYCLLIP